VSFARPAVVVALSALAAGVHLAVALFTLEGAAELWDCTWQIGRNFAAEAGVFSWAIVTMVGALCVAYFAAAPAAVALVGAISARLPRGGRTGAASVLVFLGINVAMLAQVDEWATLAHQRRWSAAVPEIIDQAAEAMSVSRSKRYSIRISFAFSTLLATGLLALFWSAGHDAERKGAKT
jgi:hypothetical protein